ncbi:MAG: molybdate ABC transporter substrate-binding protein [Proteobacteria bacterium]|nr:molybdate ABC transporter substrate-binding protein [Pseudomonadota bacterium]
MVRIFAWLLVAGVLSGTTAAVAEETPVLVFDAASLTNVIDDMAKAFTDKTKLPVKSSPAASSALARQIEAGAPADVFFSADLEWMDYLDQKKLLKAGSRHDVVGNSLVLIAPADSAVTIKLKQGVDLGSGKIATGDPDSVPVGKYAKAALKKLDVWDKVSGHIVRAENVRAALAFVARAEVPLGIVYKTDALAEKKVRIVAEFPRDTYSPITYPIAVTTHGGAAAQQFVDFVRSKPAREIFEKYGFAPLH